MPDSKLCLAKRLDGVSESATLKLNAAVQAMKKWEFEPGTKEGKPVDVLVSVEMTFNLK